MQPNRRTVQLGLLTLAAGSLVALVAATTTRTADSSAFVGVLSLAVEDQAAQQLGLSDEVREQLRRLVERRVNEATKWRWRKDLPPDPRTEQLAPFIAESERLGLELLTQEQRSKLNELRLQRTGMASLANEGTAKLLALTVEQRDEVARLMAERTKAMTRGGDKDRTPLGAPMIRVGSVLTSAEGDVASMAGLGPGPTTPAPADTPPAPAAGRRLHATGGRAPGHRPPKCSGSSADDRHTGRHRDAEALNLRVFPVTRPLGRGATTCSDHDDAAAAGDPRGCGEARPLPPDSADQSNLRRRPRRQVIRGSNRRSRRTSNCDSTSGFNLGRMCWTGWPSRPICRCSRRSCRKARSTIPTRLNTRPPKPST